MFEELKTDANPNEIDNVVQLLHELEQNRSEDIRKQRAHARVQITTGVTLRPANTSDREKLTLTGTTADISETGCQAAFAAPCAVGDVYLLEFDHDVLDLPRIFARCLRCRLIRDDAFEAAFCFFTPVTLPETLLMSVGGA